MARDFTTIQALVGLWMAIRETILEMIVPPMRGLFVLPSRFRMQLQTAKA